MSQDLSPGLFDSMAPYFYCPNFSDKYEFVLTHLGATEVWPESVITEDLLSQPIFFPKK